MEFAVFESGNGREEVAKFCEVYNMPAMKTPLVKPSKRKEANSYKRTEQAQVEGSKTKKQWKNSASIALKKNTNNIDLHEDKLSREKKTCV